MKKNVSLILLSIFGSLFGLFLFEVVAYLPLKKIRERGGVVIRNQDAANESRGIQYDKLLGWRGIPGIKCEVKGSPEVNMWVTINSKSFRDKEHSYLSERKLYKIVALGDSFVWGVGVEPEDRLTDILEFSLKNKGIESEVINLGMLGYSTDQEYLLFQSEGIKYKPNLVILVLYSDDIDANPLRNISYYQKPAFRFTKAGTLKLTNVPVPTQNDITVWLKNHSSIYYLYTVFLTKINLFRNLCIMVGLMEDEEYIKQQAVLLTKELLRNLFNLVKQNNSDFLVVLIPDRKKAENTQRNGDFTAIAAFIRSDLQSHVLDLRPLLFKDTGKYYFKADPHWTAEGHRLAADTIFTYLVENRFLSQNRSAAK